MTWFLLFTIVGADLTFDVIKYPVASEVVCQQSGRDLAESLLLNMPSVGRVTYRCVGKSK